jgi:hypothetical protein
MQEHEEKPIAKVFDYLALRLLVGVIAMAMPIVVTLFAAQFPPSISASYHTPSRDLFVGMLFVVGVFLFAYKGHTVYQEWAANFAATAAIIAAIFPTSCDGQNCPLVLGFIDPFIASDIHNYAALVLFLVLAYFCLFPFREKAREKGPKGKLRSNIYITCGLVIIGCILAIIVAVNVLSDEVVNRLNIIYWAEFAALFFFGIAWFVAGKWYKLKLLVDSTETSYEPFKKSGKKDEKSSS